MARTNSAEGGTDGVTVSAANSGGASGDAYGTVVVGASATCAYSNARAAHGTMSVLTATGASNVSAYTPCVLASVTEDYSRGYFNVDVLPGAIRPLMRYTSGGGQALRVSVVSTGTIRVLDAANNTAGTTTATISVDQWFRVELHVTFSATVGACELRLYTTPDSDTPTETLNLTSLALLASSDEIRFGVAANATNAVAAYHDDVGTEGVTWFGPAVNTVTGTADRVTTFGTSVAGTRTVSGTAARATTFGSAATGTRQVSGTADRMTAFSGTATGTRTVLGAATRVTTFGATAAGTRAVTGTAALATTFGAPAAGTRTVLGAAARPTEFAATASGLRSVTGTVARATTFASSAVGLRTVTGTASRVTTFAAAAAGTSTERPGTLATSTSGSTLTTSSSGSVLTATTSGSTLHAY